VRTAAAALALAAAVAAGAVSRYAPAAATGSPALAGRELARSEPGTDAVPVLYELPPFSLVESSGRPLRRDDLLGRPHVAGFIFTRCSGVCPRMTSRMARLRDELPALVGLLSFTVDPAYDTPAVLARHARALQAGPRWLFVTGEQAALHRLAVEGFKLATAELPPEQAALEGPFLHSPRLVLVDERARVRGYYDSNDEQEMRDLVRDAGRLWPAHSAAR
jgi:protein SCO1/2